MMNKTKQTYLARPYNVIPTQLLGVNILVMAVFVRNGDSIPSTAIG